MVYVFLVKFFRNTRKCFWLKKDCLLYALREMSSSTLKSEGQQQFQDPLVAIEEEIDELKGERKKLKEKIEALEHKPQAERSEEDRKDLTAKESRLSALDMRLAGLEADRRELRAHASSASATAQQGKRFHISSIASTDTFISLFSSCDS